VIKERRRADGAPLDAAHRFLNGDLPIDNRCFAVQPAQPADLHRPVLRTGSWTTSCA
jgi:hypothetical protein